MTTASKQLYSLRLSLDVIEDIKSLAEKECRTFNKQVEHILNQYVTQLDNLPADQENAND